jgi:hypothetical protein
MDVTTACVMVPTGSGPGTGWVTTSPGIQRNATNGNVSVRGSYYRFASTEDYAPPYVVEGEIRTIGIGPAIFADGTPAWYQPSLVVHPMYGSGDGVPGNDANVFVRIGGLTDPDGKVSISAELRAERPDRPYGTRSGYARKHVKGEAPAPFWDGKWHEFKIDVPSHDRYRMFCDGVLIADVQEKLPATMSGRNRIGLRCDMTSIAIRGWKVTTERPAPMTLNVHPREDWQDPAQAVSGPKAKSAGGTWVIHYPGGGSFEPHTDAQVKTFLRQIQASYLNGRGYSIGYSYGVAQSGSAWEIRGDDFNPASNRGRKIKGGNFNDVSRSIFVMVGNDNAASPEAVATINAIIATRPGWPVVTHGDVDYTACCGTGLIAQVRAGTIGQQVAPSKPTPITPDPTEDDDMLNATSLWRPDGYANIFAVTPDGARHLGGETFNDLTRRLNDAGQSSAVIVSGHKQELKSVLALAGLTTADLIKTN